ncbi:hypothetical protein CRENBAI_005222 [Crenichthys baileyi]|uniref:Uncharacterized protein n=1 Tax=Crenichthys baileyi TaxID=28760 RepID=A0AAV9S5N2_9TELE
MYKVLEASSGNAGTLETGYRGTRRFHREPCQVVTQGALETGTNVEAREQEYKAGPLGHLHELRDRSTRWVSMDTHIGKLGNWSMKQVHLDTLIGDFSSFRREAGIGAQRHQHLERSGCVPPSCVPALETDNVAPSCI